MSLEDLLEQRANRTPPRDPQVVLAGARARAADHREGPGRRPLFGYVAAALVLVVAGAAAALAAGVGEKRTDVATAPQEDPSGSPSATLARNTGVVEEAGGYLWVLGGYFDGPDFQVPERGRVPNTAVTVHDAAGIEIASIDLPIGDDEYLYDPRVVAVDGRFYVVTNVCPLPTGEIAVCGDSKGTGLRRRRRGRRPGRRQVGHPCGDGLGRARSGRRRHERARVGCPDRR